MAHLDHATLRDRLLAACLLVRVNSCYKHYKYPDRNYLVLGLSIQEASEKVCVRYRDILAPDSPEFVRDLDSWLAQVEVNGILVDRFTLVHT